MYNKVNTLPTLDICLTVVSIEYREEPFKGLSCPVPLGQPVHPFGLMRVFFSAFSAWICAVVWQVNGAQQQTPCYDLQSDLIFAGACNTDWTFGERVPVPVLCVGAYGVINMGWFHHKPIFFFSIELLKMTCHGAECLHVQFFLSASHKQCKR